MPKIISNSVEDFGDELTSGYIYKYANIAMKPLKDAIRSDNDDDSIMIDALEGALTTFQYSTMNSVIVVINEMVVLKLITTSGLIYSYIKGSSVASKLKSKTRGVLSALGSKGGAIGKFIQGGLGVVLGTQEERLAMANMANNNVNNVTSLLISERQNQIHMKNGRKRHFDNVISTSQKAKMTNDDRKINLFTHKMKSGSWTTKSDDKKLYEDATGFDFTGSGLVYNLKFVNKLNSLSEYAVDVEGNIVNLAKVQLDTNTTMMLSKLK